MTSRLSSPSKTAASSDADGFQVNDALVEMDANLEYRLLADEVCAWRARGQLSCCEMAPIHVRIITSSCGSSLKR